MQLRSRNASRGLRVASLRFAGRVHFVSRWCLFGRASRGSVCIVPDSISPHSLPPPVTLASLQLAVATRPRVIATRQCLV